LLQIPLIEAPLARLEGRNGVLSTVVFADGSELARQAHFLRPTMHPRSGLAARLACELVEDVPIPGLVRVDATWQTTAPGVYAAGEVASPLHVFMATASGGTAGAMINHGLVKEETGSPDELPEERHVA
jgi:thioredoxin reductase